MIYIYIYIKVKNQEKNIDCNKYLTTHYRNVLENLT